MTLVYCCRTGLGLLDVEPPTGVEPVPRNSGVKTHFEWFSIP